MKFVSANEFYILHLFCILEKLGNKKVVTLLLCTQKGCWVIAHTPTAIHTSSVERKPWHSEQAFCSWMKRKLWVTGT